MHTCPVHGSVTDEQTMIASGVRVCAVTVEGTHMVLRTIAGTTALADGEQVTAKEAVYYNGVCGEEVNGN